MAIATAVEALHDLIQYGKLGSGHRKLVISDGYVNKPKEDKKME